MAYLGTMESTDNVLHAKNRILWLIICGVMTAEVPPKKIRKHTYNLLLKFGLR